MEFLDRMRAVTDYVEEHLKDEIDYSEVSKLVGCGVYEFSRIFSYVTGVGFSEYVRRRRLSVAAEELARGSKKVIDAALDYGYQSPDAFGRAFYRMHGITPREAGIPGTVLKHYSMLSFELKVKGDKKMDYRIERPGVLRFVGVDKSFGRFTADRQQDDWKAEMGEVWDFWDTFLNGEVDRKLSTYYRPPFWQVGVNKTDEKGELTVFIGAQAVEDRPEGVQLTIPEYTWAVFRAKGSLSEEEHPIGRALTEITAEFFPKSSYERVPGLEIEVYGPGDTLSEDYVSEIWIPVREK